MTDKQGHNLVKTNTLLLSITLPQTDIRPQFEAKHAKSTRSNSVRLKGIMVIDQPSPSWHLHWVNSEHLHLDSQIRLAAFNFLDEQTRIHGDVLPRKVLEQGFTFNGERVPLIAPQGIFTPRIMKLPLTFCTVPPKMGKLRPYNDELGDQGVIRYRYRGQDPHHRDNMGLRKCMEAGLPLIYLFGVVPGKYLPVWPAFID